MLKRAIPVTEKLRCCLFRNIIIIVIIYLFIKHTHIDGRKQDNGTGQQGTHSRLTLTVGLHKACNYCQTFAIQSNLYKIIYRIMSLYPWLISLSHPPLIRFFLF